MKYSGWNIFVVILLMVLAGCKKQEVDRTKAFVKYYGGLKASAGVEVLQTPDGGYVIAGTSNIGTSNADNYDMIIIKTDGEGNELWHKTFGGAFYDECGALAITPDGNYILVGTYGITPRAWNLQALEFTRDSTEMVAIKLDPNGNQVWEKKYHYSNPAVKIGTFGKAIVVNGDGTCFLGGMVDSSGTFVNLDLFGVVVDQYGDLIKVGGLDMKPLAYGADQAADYMSGAIKAFSTGLDEYLIVSSTIISGQPTPRLVKCRMNGVALTHNNAPTKTQWTNSPGSADLESAIQICRTMDNHYMMTGAGLRNGNSDFYMFKLDGFSLNDNGIGFLRYYGGDDFDAGASIIATSDGGYAVLATTKSVIFTGSPEKQEDVLLMKFKNDGEKEWERVFGGNGKDVASRVIQTQDGGYLICGTIAFGDDVSNTGTSNSITLVKVNSQGEISDLK